MESTNKFNDHTSADLLAACGFIFPQDELALARFNALYGDIDPDITGEEVNPLRIIKNTPVKHKKVYSIGRMTGRRQNRLVANKLRPLPTHIQQRLKKGGSAIGKPEDPQP